MMRDPNLANIRINLVLKNGETFIERDTTNIPFGDRFEVVSIWVGDNLRVYPMSEVAYFELVP